MSFASQWVTFVRAPLVSTLHTLLVVGVACSEVAAVAMVAGAPFASVP